MSRPCVWVFCGGISSENAISILSARHIVSCLLAGPYSVKVNFISQTGQWWVLDNAQDLLESDPAQLVAASLAKRLLCVPGELQPLRLYDDAATPLPCDCVFSVLHGTGGEDGLMQGCLQTLQLPLVGCDTLSSAICMAKHVTKPLLAAAGIAVTPGVTLYKGATSSVSYATVSQEWGEVLFIKPASQGSSVGVSRVDSEATFNRALKHAFEFDDVVLVEQAVIAREIECSVLGNDDIQVALPGEVVNHGQFYSFDAKYLNDNEASIVSPAELTREQVAAAQALAQSVYRVLGCRGYARVDLFLQDNGTWLVNEINTLPGFTPISLYPKNWEASAMDAVKLVQRLVDLACQQHGHWQARWQRALEHQPQSHSLQSAATSS